MRLQWTCISLLLCQVSAECFLFPIFKDMTFRYFQVLFIYCRSVFMPLLLLPSTCQFPQISNVFHIMPKYPKFSANSYSVITFWEKKYSILCPSNCVIIDKYVMIIDSTKNIGEKSVFHSPLVLPCYRTCSPCRHSQLSS